MAVKGWSFLLGSLFPCGFCFFSFLCCFPPLLVDTSLDVHIHQPWIMLPPPSTVSRIVLHPNLAACSIPECPGEGGVSAQELF